MRSWLARTLRIGQDSAPAETHSGIDSARQGVVGIPGLPPVTNLINPQTGLGGSMDRSVRLQFVDPQLTHGQLETIYRSSWAARKAVDIPIDDMFTPGRLWVGDNKAEILRMEEAEAELDVHAQLTGAMKTGSLFGTGLLIIIEKGKNPDSEFKPERVTRGGIANLLVVDKFNAGIDSWVIDERKPRYGKPFMYHITPRIGHQPLIRVHHSRVIRFDGVRSPTTEGWNSMFRDWGFPRLNSAINEIAREEAMHISVDQLLQEASVHVMKIHGLKEALRGRTSMDELSVEELGTAANMNKSLYRIMFTDVEDDTDRLAVNFSGIPDLIDKKSSRLAALFDIPVTRFLGVSPGGMNATGDHDMLNYAIRLETERNRYMLQSGNKLDLAIARHAGLIKPPESEWQPVMQVSPQVRSDNAAKQAKAIIDAYNAGLILETEARDRLNYIEDWFGELSTDEKDFLDELHRFDEPVVPAGMPGGGAKIPGKAPPSKPTPGSKPQPRPKPAPKKSDA